jgi:hypothetical protein
MDMDRNSRYYRHLAAPGCSRAALRFLEQPAMLVMLLLNSFSSKAMDRAGMRLVFFSSCLTFVRAAISVMTL